MDDRSFPISQPRLLREVLTKEVILCLFRQYKASNTTSWQDINVDELCDEVYRNHIRVLAILILFDTGWAIVQFRDSGVSDAKLPLKYTDEVLASDLHLAGQPDTRLACFDDPTWGIQKRKDICRTQWHLNVPYMKMGPHYSPEHTDFPDDVVLPWCKPEQNLPQTAQSARIKELGGYSLVKRVYIHPEYHGFRKILDKIGLSSCSNNFALKILNREQNEELDRMYQNEIEQLKSFNGTIAPNLVTLLTTFKHQDKRHFLFPWATCDLFSYWDTEQTQPRMLENARWFSKQIVGLVEAVSAIHWPLHMEHRYGRHGDLKPDNILWFKPYKKDPKGILVVSDMGFTVAHSTYSRSKDAPGKVAHFTPEYRPPELDTETGFVSRKYDVWTLGCIFLEMVIWFLGGKEERDQFRADRRSVEQKYGTSIFTFFALVSRGSELQAHVKQSVFDHMEKIRQHAYKSQFTHDIVNIIQNHMILVDPGERADIRSLQKEFAKINDKCQKDTNYSKMATPSNSVLEQDTQGNYTWLCPSRSMCSACLGASNTDE